MRDALAALLCAVLCMSLASGVRDGSLHRSQVRSRIPILSDRLGGGSGVYSAAAEDSNQLESDLGDLSESNLSSPPAGGEAADQLDDNDRADQERRDDHARSIAAAAGKMHSFTRKAMQSLEIEAAADDPESRAHGGVESQDDSSPAPATSLDAVSPPGDAQIESEDSSSGALESPDADFSVDDTAALLRATVAAEDATRKAKLAQQAAELAHQAQTQERSLHAASDALSNARARLAALESEEESQEEDAEDDENVGDSQEDDEEGATDEIHTQPPPPSSPSSSSSAAASSVHHHSRFASAPAPSPSPSSNRTAKTAPRQKSALSPAKLAAALDADKAYIPQTKGFSPPCDILAERGVCLYGGQKVLVPDAVSKGLTAWFKFDEAHPLDSSRLQNHGTSVMLHGPGRGGFGSSARFDGDTFLEVPSSKSLSSMLVESSLTVWAFFILDREDKENFDCPIAYMGREQDSIFELRYNPKTRKISATIIKNWLTLKSRAKLGPSMWHHIALTKGRQFVQLYINGVLDVEAQLPRELVGSISKVLPHPLYQFYAGAVPWNGRRFGNGKCNVPLLLDDLRLYNRELRTEEVEADSGSALGSVEPSFIRFGCEKCTFADAVKSCPKSYHLCYKPELLAGALSAARKMGWVTLKVPVWENDVTDQTPEHKGPVNELRVGLCCAY